MEKQLQIDGTMVLQQDLENNPIKTLVSLSDAISAPLYIKGEDLWLYALDKSTYATGKGGSMGLDNDDCITVKSTDGSDTFTATMIMSEALPPVIGTALSNDRAVEVIDYDTGQATIRPYGILHTGKVGIARQVQGKWVIEKRREVF